MARFQLGALCWTSPVLGEGSGRRGYSFIPLGLGLLSQQEAHRLRALGRGVGFPEPPLRTNMQELFSALGQGTGNGSKHLQPPGYLESGGLIKQESAWCPCSALCVVQCAGLETRKGRAGPDRTRCLKLTAITGPALSSAGADLEANLETQTFTHSSQVCQATGTGAVL